MGTKKVLLVYPYFYTGAIADQIFSPIGIGILSAVLKKMGIDVMVIDCTFLTMEETVNRAQKYKPDITGIYVMTTLTNNALEIIKQLKILNPESIHVTGGPLPTLYPEKFAEIFDYVFKGEAAKSLCDFCRDYFDAVSKTEFLKTIKSSMYSGLCSRTIKSTDAPPAHLTEEEINACPITDRSGFDHEKYRELNFRYTGKRTATIMTTYGCPFSCDFCSKPVFGNEVRFRNPDRIFEEIRDIVSYGYDSLWIADDLFTFDAEFLRGFCNRMIRENLCLTWSCLSRVDSVNDEIARLMKNSGCSKVYLGIESGNDHVLKLMNKNINTTQIRNGVEVFKNNGIDCAGFFMVGYPGETAETVKQTFEFALALELDEISFNVPYPLPGSKLYEKVSGISDLDWTIENETRFLYKSDFDEKWIETGIKETLAKFAEAKERRSSAAVSFNDCERSFYYGKFKSGCQRRNLPGAPGRNAQSAEKS